MNFKNQCTYCTLINNIQISVKNKLNTLMYLLDKLTHRVMCCFMKVNITFSGISGYNSRSL